MVIRELVGKCIAELKENNIENAVFDAHLIVREVLGLEPIDLVLDSKREVSEEDAKKAFAFCKRRCQREPLQYILGVQEFMGIGFEVDKDVLIPRADTETLVEEALKFHGGMNVLDICSGSGCIALSVAHFNKNAYVTGLDISDKALSLSAKNAERLKLTERVRFKKCNILTQVPDGVYDLILSNPPYIETDEIDKLQKEVRAFEPRLALDGGADGLMFYRRICSVAPKLLQRNGRLLFEVGFNQADAVEELMTDCGLKNIRRIKDLCGVERVLCGERAEK